MPLEFTQDTAMTVSEQVLRPQEIHTTVSTAKISSQRAWRVQPSHEHVEHELVGEQVGLVDEKPETAVSEAVPTDETTVAAVSQPKHSQVVTVHSVQGDIFVGFIDISLSYK